MTSSLSRRTLLTGGLSLATVGALTACSGKASGGSPSASSDKTLSAVVGYNGDGNGAMLEAIAQKQGFWKKHGLNISAKKFTNGPLQIQALGAGSLDFGYIGPGAIWLPIEGKAKIIAVEALGQSDRVIAKRGINSVRQLKGKTIGVPQGTSGAMLLGLALDKAGMSIHDVNQVSMDPSTVISAFTAGKIDAAAIWYPFVAQIKKAVPGMVEVVKSSDFPDLAFPSCLVAGPNIAQKPELLRRYQAAAKDALDWAAAHTSELPQLMASFLKVSLPDEQSEFKFIDVLKPSEFISKWDSGTAPKWFENLNKQFIAMGTIKTNTIVDPSKYVLFKEYKNA